jgi:hypothetical protein
MSTLFWNRAKVNLLPQNAPWIADIFNPCALQHIARALVLVRSLRVRA